MERLLWLIGGPNGSGKSTFATMESLRGLSATPEQKGSEFAIINPDRLAQDYRATGHPDAERAAALRADALMDEYIDEGKSFARETVLSTDRLRPLLKRARSNGYRIGVLFIFTQSPELNIARVAARVLMGGHNVPEEKIRARWTRAMRILPVYAKEADVFAAWDNSFVKEGPKLVVSKVNQEWHFTAHAKVIEQARKAHAALKMALRELRALAQKSGS
jgi:predicted ABC-type ATPase